MAGNVWEYTMEVYNYDYNGVRGGYCSSAGSDFPASCHHVGSFPYDGSRDGIGSRVALYVNL